MNNSRKIAFVLSFVALSTASTPAIASTQSGTTQSDAASVFRIQKSISSSGNSAKAWRSLSSSEKNLIKREMMGGQVKVSMGPAKMQAASYTGCWTRTSQSIYIGGVTRSKMFGVAQTVTTCSKSGRVTSVKVIDRHGLTFAYPNVATTKLLGAALNVGYEGRAISRIDGGVGVVINGSEIGVFKTICTALYMNANGHDIRMTGDCELQH